MKYSKRLNIRQGVKNNGTFCLAVLPRDGIKPVAMAAACNGNLCFKPYDNIYHFLLYFHIFRL